MMCVLLRSQCKNWVDGRSATRRQPCGQERCGRKNNNDRGESESVMSLDSIDISARELDGKPCQQTSDRQPHGDQQKGAAQNERKNVALRRPESNAQADFARTLRNSKRQQAVKS